MSVESAQAVYDVELAESRRAAHEATRDYRLVEALRDRRPEATREAARSLLLRLDLAAITVLGPSGQALDDTGSDEPVAETMQRAEAAALQGAARKR